MVPQLLNAPQSCLTSRFAELECSQHPTAAAVVSSADESRILYVKGRKSTDGGGGIRASEHGGGGSRLVHGVRLAVTHYC